MSTKAYDFFIMDKKKLNQYLLYVKKAIGLCFIAHFKRHTELNVIFQKGLSEAYNEYKKILPEITKVMQCPTYTDKEHLDLTCGVSVWLWKEYAVVKIYGFNGGLANLLKQPRYVKDFSYWNSTDKPEEISGKEWYRRSFFFDKIIDSLPLMSYVPYDFLSRDSFNAVFELYREYKDYIKK